MTCEILHAFSLSLLVSRHKDSVKSSEALDDIKSPRWKKLRLWMIMRHRNPNHHPLGHGLSKKQTHTEISHWELLELCVKVVRLFCYSLKDHLGGIYESFTGFPMVLVVKNLPANAGDTGLIPGSGRCPGGRHGTQHPSLENRMERGAWQATVHRVAKS